MNTVFRPLVSRPAGCVGAPQGRFQAFLIFCHPTCLRLPGELPGISQLFSMSEPPTWKSLV